MRYKNNDSTTKLQHCPVQTAAPRSHEFDITIWGEKDECDLLEFRNECHNRELPGTSTPVLWYCLPFFAAAKPAIAIILLLKDVFLICV